MSITDARFARSDARELAKLGKNPAQVRKEQVSKHLKGESEKHSTSEIIAFEWMDKQVENSQHCHIESAAVHFAPAL